MSSDKVIFSPKGILFSAIGFFLGLFFCNTIVAFLRDLFQTGTPTSNILGSLLTNLGVGTLVGVVLIILSIILFKKFAGFIIAVFVGIAACLILTGMGIVIPDPGSLISGLV